MSCSVFFCNRSFSQPVANIFQHLAVKAAECIKKGISLAFMTSLSIFPVFSCLDPASEIQLGKYQSRVIKNPSTDLSGKKASADIDYFLETKCIDCCLEIIPQEEGSTELCFTGNLTKSSQSQARLPFFFFPLILFLAEFRRILICLPQ